MARASTAALVLATVVLSGCGWRTSLGPVGSPDGPRLSRTEFVSQVEAACTRRTKAIAALPRPRREDDREQFFANVAGLELEEASALASIRPPRPDEGEFARLVAASRELALISQRFLIGVARDEAHARRRALSDAERASSAYDRAAKQLRITCRQSA
jgi:hypothetical protein